ncbi:hypothetical protein ACFVZM_12685 [Streptomyces sioyaensis]|uniref:hypothetical protein n=1 Tax=Streptomyces sioyaensis TaxID=67364 RepID=UPI0036BD1A29
MFRPLRVCADVPSPRALLPVSLIARIHPRPKPPEVSEVSEVSGADTGAQE